MRPMVWLTGVLLFVVGAALFARGAHLLSVGLHAQEASFRVWTESFWLKRPGFSAMGLGHNVQWLARLGGGAIAMVFGWRLVRIAGRMD